VNTATARSLTGGPRIKTRPASPKSERVVLTASPRQPFPYVPRVESASRLDRQFARLYFCRIPELLLLASIAKTNNLIGDSLSRPACQIMACCRTALRSVRCQTARCRTARCRTARSGVAYTIRQPLKGGRHELRKAVSWGGASGATYSFIPLLIM
jgi:hypothetical protein